MFKSASLINPHKTQEPITLPQLTLIKPKQDSKEPTSTLWWNQDEPQMNPNWNPNEPQTNSNWNPNEPQTNSNWIQNDSKKLQETQPEFI